MKVYAKRLERLISLNRLEQAVDTLLNTISDFKPDDLAGRDESKHLRNQIITLSQRMHQAGDNLKNGLSSEDDVSRERLNISTTLLDLISDLDRYPAFAYFIREVEDEEAWKTASRSNTISGYQEYFNNFPDGKYKDQTQDLIKELVDVENRRSEEMKRIAVEEKRRRDQQYRHDKTDADAKEPARGTRSESYSQANSNRDTRRPAYGSPDILDDPGSGKEHWDKSYLIAAYIGTVIIAIAGIGIGIFLRVAKKNGQTRFDEETRKHGTYLIIWGAVVWLITYSMFYG